jgi:uncharacterized membrane protein YwaF
MLYFDFINPYLMYVITVFTTLFLIWSIFKKRSFIREHKRVILLIVAILLTWTQLARYGGVFFAEGKEWSILFLNFRINPFSLSTGLPFYMCRLSVLVLLYYAFTQDKRVESFLFYWGALGLAGVVYPNGEIPNIANLTETFFIDHILLTVIPFFLVVYQGYIPKLKDMIYITVLMFIILCIFIFINPIFNTDYFYVQDQSIFAVLFGRQNSFVFAFVHSIVAMGFFSIYYLYFRNKEFELR